MRVLEDVSHMTLNPFLLEISNVDAASLYAGSPSSIFLNLKTMQVTTHPDADDELSGGILCEEMGTGKTLICIAERLSDDGKRSKKLEF